MCCKSLVLPVPDEWPAILTIAGFTPDDGRWHREVGGSQIYCSDNTGISLAFSLSPTIGSHSLGEHQVNAAAAAVLFKTLMTLAERVDGEIIQSSLVGDCATENGTSSRILAQYPRTPLRFENLCLGFRTVLLKGVGQ